MKGNKGKPVIFSLSKNSSHNTEFKQFAKALCSLPQNK
jgi:hypothetical protein